MALELKKGPGRSCSKLAGLITVCPLVGEQLGGLYRVPTWKGNVTISTWKRSPVSLPKIPPSPFAHPLQWTASCCGLVSE